LCCCSNNNSHNHEQDNEAPRTNKLGPSKDIRRCLITREKLPKDQLWRIVRTRDENGRYKVQLDKGKGRSVYISKDIQIVLRAQTRVKLLNQYLRCPIPKAYLAELVERSKRLQEP